MKKTLFFFIVLLLIAACQSKPDQPDESQAINGAMTLSDLPTSDQTAIAKSGTKKLMDALQEKDSCAVDSFDIECYEWENTYLATTIVEDEEGEEFELHIAITLKDYERSNYTGEITMFLSGFEGQKFRGRVTAKAQQNHVTVYFDSNIEGMDDMFEQGDKLVRFEIAYGEYVASWFAPMHEYVNEYTVLSLQR